MYVCKIVNIIRLNIVRLCEFCYIFKIKQKSKINTCNTLKWLIFIFIFFSHLSPPLLSFYISSLPFYLFLSLLPSLFPSLSLFSHSVSLFLCLYHIYRSQYLSISHTYNLFLSFYFYLHTWWHAPIYSLSLFSSDIIMTEVSQACFVLFFSIFAFHSLSLFIISLLCSCLSSIFDYIT